MKKSVITLTFCLNKAVDFLRKYDDIVNQINQKSLHEHHIIIYI